MNLRLVLLMSIVCQLELKLTSSNTSSYSKWSVESLIKCIKLIARPLLMKDNFPMTTLGYAILHVAVLILIRPTKILSSTIGFC